MAFNGAFTITENANLGTIILTNASTGSDGNLTGRTISSFRADGSVYAAPILWPLANASILLDDFFLVDNAVNIVVDWVSSAPLSSPSSYTANEVYAYIAFAEYFLYYLTQQQQATPNIIQAVGYYDNKGIVRTELDSAQSAVTLAADIKAAQACIERVQNMIDNQNSFF